MDIVIPIKDETRDFTELKFSLRSMEKHMSGIDKLYVVTNSTSVWDHFSKVNILFRGDLYETRDKEKNIMYKVEAACGHPSVSDNFLFTNDDIFLLQHFDAETFPYYRKDTLELAIAKRSFDDPYTRAMLNTDDALEERGHTTYHFDVHSPIVYNKRRFVEAVNEYPWMTTKRGFLVKSLYANSIGLDGPYLSDVKIKRPAISQASIYRRIKQQPMFSIDDAALNKNMLDVLHQLYPTPSRWER